MAANRREFLLGAATFAANTSFSSLALAADSAKTTASAKTANTPSPFLLEFDGGALTSLRFAADAFFSTNYVARRGRNLVILRLRGDVPKAHGAKSSTQQRPRHPIALQARIKRGTIAVRLSA